MFVVVGAAAPCRLEPESSWLVAVELLALTVVELAAVRLGRLTARAAAPTTPAAPAPRVIADTQASPLLRASCRAEAEGGRTLGYMRHQGHASADCCHHHKDQHEHQVDGVHDGVDHQHDEKDPALRPPGELSAAFERGPCG